MSKHFYQFLLVLLISMTIFFFIHLSYLNNNLTELRITNFLIKNYSINYISAGIIFIIIELVKKKNHQILGFIFMLGSLLKFAIYFLFIYSDIPDEVQIKKTYFLMFFIPYFISLANEVLFLSRLLNSEQLNENASH
jgi:hypothetical protein